MTAHERLNVRPAAVHPSLRRAPARNAQVCSNSDNQCDKDRPRTHNGPAFSHGNGVRALRTLAPRPWSSLKLIWHTLKSHR